MQQEFLLWLLFVKGRNPERVQKNEIDTLVNEFMSFIKEIMDKEFETISNILEIGV